MKNNLYGCPSLSFVDVLLTLSCFASYINPCFLYPFFYPLLPKWTLINPRHIHWFTVIQPDFEILATYTIIISVFVK